jgi:DNA-binding transcriptional LysR family regulator
MEVRTTNQPRGYATMDHDTHGPEATPDPEPADPLTELLRRGARDLIKQAVEAGLGLGVVSLHIVQSELASGVLCVLDVQGFPLMREWYLVQREGKRLSPAARAFSDFVLTEAKRVARLDGVE